MPISSRFFRSVYVTLGLACASLVYAELVFLPEMAIFGLVVAILLVIAYRVEGKWSLSIGGANLLGAVIAVGACVYVVAQVFRASDTSLIHTLPWPTSLLPYLGPLLLVLVPAKLFRPKHIGDYWGLQGIGLIAVALGCALAGDIAFGLLMLAYLISLIWSLTLFYFYRGSRGLEPVTTAEPEQRLLSKSGGWAAIGTVLALALFLITPRLGEARWEFAIRTSGLQTGLSEEKPSIDLNHQGVVSVNRDLAFEVQAFEADGESPKIDLPPNQRWRNSSFNYYNSGRWEYRPDAEHRDRPSPTRTEVAVDQPGGSAPPRLLRDNDGRAANAVTAETPPAAPNTNFRDRAANQLPYLGQSQIFLRFVPQGKAAHNAILAEPIWKSPAGTPPFARQVSVVTIGRNNRQFAWFPGADDELAPPALGLVTNPMVYRQVMKAPKEVNVSDPVLASESFREHLCSIRSLSALRAWTQNLARQMAIRGTIAKETLGAGDPATDTVRVPPEHAEAVARAFAAHLSNSGEYRYSLNLQRVDDSVDPAEDFLINSRIGHCNRFATALVLMLRSVGIPSRIVLGFQGYETDGNGVYEVRQCHAHAWVEALIQRQADGKTSWHWLTLNPTPQIDDLGEGGLTWSQWMDAIRTSVGSFFRFLIVEYDADQQGRARSWFERINWAGIGQVGRRVTLGPDGTQYWRPVVFLGGIGGLWFAWKRWRTGGKPTAASADPASALHHRMTGLLRRLLALEPAPATTPAEFARLASAQLAQRTPAPGDLALPTDTVTVYYRGRYGRHEISEGDRRSLSERWDRLESELGRG